MVGALFFSWLSDKLGRRNLFMLTLGVYLFGSGLTALTLGSSGGWIVISTSPVSSPAWVSVGNTQRSTPQSTS
ncbi:MAG TPA: hypothetical protein VNA67_03325 [Pseudonocardiaceae bacterium]|nr:hypothetical protein [Pseudonocardiaceae bacterium]